MGTRHAGTASPRLVADRQRSRLARRSALALASAALASLALAAPASATTSTFSFTGAAQTWTVPAGVTQATFDLYGAQGDGVTGSPVFAPGLGGRATATIAVTPGASIQVNVGGQAPEGGLGGFNGGGFGGVDGAFGGGGASDIRIGGTDLDDRVLVAGGGGGAGLATCTSQPVWGGAGGGESGGAGRASTAPGCEGSVAGGGGTQTDGGSATFPAGEGDFGLGGNASLEGGGGGGGWWGGGGGLGTGGGGGGGGGGGSGFGPEGTSFQTGVREGNGLVNVTYGEICQGQAATLGALPAQPTIGTDGDDVIVGTEGTDAIDAGLGDDLVCARPGADQVDGGEGADVLRGNSGQDAVGGDAGADELYGGNGGDTLSGGEGDDLLFGRMGDDSLDGNAGTNTLRGGFGTDECVNGPTLINCELTPDLSVSPGGLVLTDPKRYLYDFGPAPRATQTFTVTNDGTGGSGELDLVLGDGEPEFALSNDACTDQTLAPSETCTFDVNWTSPVGCSQGALFSALVLVRSEIGDYLGLVARAVCPSLPPP